MTPAQRYLRLGHRRVEGWIEPQILTVVSDLSIAQHDLGINGSIVEIGVHHGRLFLGMHLCRTDGEKSLAIDLFEDQAKNVDGSGKGDREIFQEHLRKHAGGERDVTILAADSTTLDGDRIRDLTGQVRLFDVDGGHTREIVRHDMRTAADSVADGAIVMGDDYFNKQWPGVSEGTLDYLDSDDRLVPFAIGFNKVMFTTPGYSAGYQAALRATARSHYWATWDSEMRGHPVLVCWTIPPHRRGRKVAKRALGR